VARLVIGRLGYVAATGRILQPSGPSVECPKRPLSAAVPWFGPGTSSLHELISKFFQWLPTSLYNISFWRNGIEHRLCGTKFDYNDPQQRAFTDPRLTESRQGNRPTGSSQLLTSRVQFTRRGRRPSIQGTTDTPEIMPSVASRIRARDHLGTPTNSLKLKMLNGSVFCDC